MDTDCTVSFPVCIHALKETSRNVLKIDTSAGSFFLRIDYLDVVTCEQLEPDSLLVKNQFEDVMQAGLAYAAERAAVAYLARAEQSAFLLRRKLAAKKHESAAVEKALAFLAQNGWLSDSRYAAAFLRNRMITRSEGKRRLAAELAARGIGREIAENACAEFFCDNEESALLEKALEKCCRLGKTEEKTIKTLLLLGFEWTDIKQAVKNRF